MRAQFHQFKSLALNHQTYLDSAATTQKPQPVIEAMNEYYASPVANVHRSGHRLGREATAKFEAARATVARTFGVPAVESVLWTRGTTEAINLVAYAWGQKNLRPGNVICVSEMEHHANLVPWQRFLQAGLRLKFIPVDTNGQLDLEWLETQLDTNCKLLCVCHASNVLGSINPITRICELAHAVGARVLVDGAQAPAHIELNIRQLGCDFYAFSGHKTYGPSGIGCLIASARMMHEMTVWQRGGEMVKDVDWQHSTFQDAPLKFEAGTPHIAGAIGLAAALRWLNEQDRFSLQQRESELVQALMTGLREIPGVVVLGPDAPRVPLVSFHLPGEHCYDLASLLDEQGVYIRSGLHCCVPLHRKLGLHGTLRVSIGAYNHAADLQHFFDALHTALKIMRG